jgi:Phage terminase, small subunit
MKLTPKQQAFADFYIKCGNAAEASRKAGYSERTARTVDVENMTKPDIRQYIDEHLQQVSANRLAKADEVLEYFTRVMRGEIPDQFGLEASLADRTRAAENLAKRYGLLTGKLQVGNAGPIIIIGEEKIED